MRTLLTPRDIEAGLEAIASAIPEDPVFLVGIETGGARLAERLAQILRSRRRRVELGRLDITFYRDDFTRIGPHPEVRPTQIPWDVQDRVIWLVDDVLFTGRTIRAALGELFDYGRPKAVRLAVLFDRGGRELPIQPDVCPYRETLGPDEHAKLLIEEEQMRLVALRKEA
ncbi:MAG: bifunctional pyr operon transcriptional regulator/uracil phosphoribosyltransferase PyrR [Zetaproteobacteria bacterium]|nr:MAG: bifunctional pyr operon transcriptional regulator/uracil phosphoribosyltransferase PyrR [Zetaproteobacteria bacterium]